MAEYLKLAGQRELWIPEPPPSRGAEENLRIWEEAERIFDELCTRAEEQGQDYNEAALCALTDAYNRCIEERRRAQDLLELHRKWASRPIGGVGEPGGPDR